jgi:hypothetical protein
MFILINLTIKFLLKEIFIVKFLLKFINNKKLIGNF